MPRWVAPLLALLAVGWIAVLLSAPFLPAPLAAIAYAFGSLICHQMPERSFHLQAFQLPVCARCFGLYGGAAAATVWTGLLQGRAPRVVRRSPRTPHGLRAITLAAALPTLVTVGLEWAGVWRPSNVTRAIAGAPLGFAVAYVVMAAMARNGRDAGRPTLHYD